MLIITHSQAKWYDRLWYGVHTFNFNYYPYRNRYSYYTKAYYKLICLKGSVDANTLQV